MFNKVIIVGNLTRDIELKYLPSGSALATLGLASNRRYKKQDGTQGEEVCFIDVKLFGRSAEVANQYLRKGSKILIEGRLTLESWTDQTGVKKSRHTISAESMQMMDSKHESNNYAPDGVSPTQASPQQPTPQQGVQSSTPGVVENDSNSGVQANSGYPNSISLIEVSEDKIPF